ncbi:DUF2442 domain-containing protein [Candidatus Sumerlaeota bacterium]|nr:DUF2442 domain-containing protein [Candidatus Sumerlaeota bacterium]
MNTSEHSEPIARQVDFSEDALVVQLIDGRVLYVPLAWFPRLLHATPEQRENYELLGEGVGIHWPELDEDISVKGLLLGMPSVEMNRKLA